MDQIWTKVTNDKGGNNFWNKHLDAWDRKQKEGLLESILQVRNWFLYI